MQVSLVSLTQAKLQLGYADIDVRSLTEDSNNKPTLPITTTTQDRLHVRTLTEDPNNKATPLLFQKQQTQQQNQQKGQVTRLVSYESGEANRVHPLSQGRAYTFDL